MRNFILGVVVYLASARSRRPGHRYARDFCPRTPTPLRRELNAASPCPPWMPPWSATPRALTNPVPPTDENLIDGMKIYTMNCAGCHGGLDKKPSPLRALLLSSGSQLILHPMDDPEWHVYYAVRTGIRYTGMPAWNKALSEQEMWKVTAFLSRIEKLPPAGAGILEEIHRSRASCRRPQRGRDTRITIRASVRNQPDQSAQIYIIKVCARLERSCVEGNYAD